ncbi:MAG: T9SS type A sorting domain-containing protein [bacterium]
MKRSIFILLVALNIYGVELRVNPENTFIRKGKTFEIDIEVADVNDLGGVQLYLYFDKNKVNITPSGTPSRGSLLGGGAWILDPLIERDKGYIYMCDVLLSGSAQGTGTLAEKIVFSSLVDDPTSELTFGTTTLLKSDLETEIPISRVVNGKIFPYFIDFPSFKVYPNPYRADKERNRPYIVFEIPDGSDILIYTISGILIKEFRDAIGPVFWMLDNQANKPVSSGMYIYEIKNKDGRKAKGKVGVVK